jgi:hypothetical protein
VKAKVEQLRITRLKLHAQSSGIKEVTDESMAVNTREYTFEQNNDLLATQVPRSLPDGCATFQLFDNLATNAIFHGLTAKTVHESIFLFG